MDVLVFGAGAMGSVFGGFLSRKNNVTLVGRKNHIDAINEKGLTVSGIWGRHSFRGVQALESADDIPKNTFFDLIMITVKSFDTAQAVEAVKPFVGDETAVMSMQNGIGNEEVIVKAVGAEHTMGGMAIFGARLPEPGHAEVTVYAAPCRVGEIGGGRSARAEKIAAVFTETGIPAEASESIIRDKWMKAFYNIALNPLSAILRVPYGELGKKEETRTVMKALLKEAFAVAEAVGVSLDITWDGYFQYLMEKQLPPTASHISSMLQDIERGRQTEIDYLNGAIVRLGGEKGVETPVNNLITRYIKGLGASDSPTPAEMVKGLLDLSRKTV
ncbi:MAG: 2-dehydropantoate 2-reductase [Methanobacteriota archaeon]|nr:MAG: 2-dehydropantoate 2-reductase [Euryarchaeota archaeon]